MDKEQIIRDTTTEIIDLMDMPEEYVADYYDDIMQQVEIAFDENQNSEDFCRMFYNDYADGIEPDAGEFTRACKIIYDLGKKEYSTKMNESTKINFNKIYECNFSRKGDFKKDLPVSPGFPFEGENTSTKSAKEMPAKINGKPNFSYEKATDLLKAREPNEGVTYNAKYAKTGSLTEALDDDYEDEVDDEEWDEYQDMDEEGQGLGTDFDDDEEVPVCERCGAPLEDMDIGMTDGLCGDCFQDDLDNHYNDDDDFDGMGGDYPTDEDEEEYFATNEDDELEESAPTHTRSGRLIERKIPGIISPALKQCFDDFEKLNEMVKNRIIDKDTANSLLED